MKLRNLYLSLISVVFFLLLGCEKELMSPESSEQTSSEAVLKSAPVLLDGSYELIEADDFDPLWKFHKSGSSMVLETDPGITSWGSDYWGYWDEPFDLDGNSLTYIAGGLTKTTYEFTVLPDSTIDVNKTLIVAHYLSGDTTVTLTHPGIYQFIEDSDDGSGGDNGDEEPTPEWSVISSENFENGFTVWADNGYDAGLYTGASYASEGNNAANIQDNSGRYSSIQHYYFDATQYTNLEISFTYYAVSMEYREDFSVQFYDGGQWQTIANYIRGTDFSNNQFNDVLVNISADDLNFTRSATFRIICDASGNNDDVFIDEIRVRGLK